MKKIFNSIYIFLFLFFSELFNMPAARAMNVQESLSNSVGECIATFVASVTGESIKFAGDTFYNEEDLLGDITLDTERGKRFMSADGSRDVIMHSLPRAGTREVKFLLGTDLDKLKNWGQAKPQKLFDFDFYYKYNTQSAEGARIQRHKRCFFVDMPIQGVGRDKGYVTCKISFGDVAEVDPATDQEV